MTHDAWTRWLARRAAALALLCLCACGGDEGSGGAAGMAATPSLGMACTLDCVSGSTCGSAGVFPGQCSTLCTTDLACNEVKMGALCFGSECGLPCTTDAQCPTGTTCQLVSGKNACKLAPMTR